MHIESIRVTPVEVPFETAFVGATYKLTGRRTLVCEVRLDDGTRTLCHSGNGHEDPRQVAHLAEQLGAALVGRSVFDLEQNWQLMMASAGKVSGLGRQRFNMHAVSVVDIALWHTVGVVLEQPLCRLLGAEPRPIPSMFVGGYYGPEGDSRLDAERAVGMALSLGTTAIKLKVGGGTVEADLAKHRHALEAADGALEFVCDANGAWSREEALRFLRGVEGDIPEWVEEPTNWHAGPGALAELRRASPVSIGAGQSEISPVGAFGLLIAGAVDVVNFDAGWGGGITGWRKVAAAADLLGIRVAHHVEPHIAMHLLPLVERVGYVECFDARRDPVWHEMIAPVAIVDGCIQAPDVPGLGVEIDEGFVRRFALN